MFSSSPKLAMLQTRGIYFAVPTACRVHFRRLSRFVQQCMRQPAVAAIATIVKDAAGCAVPCTEVACWALMLYSTGQQAPLQIASAPEASDFTPLISALTNPDHSPQTDMDETARRTRGARRASCGSIRAAAATASPTTTATRRTRPSKTLAAKEAAEVDGDNGGDDEVRRFVHALSTAEVRQ